MMKCVQAVPPCGGMRPSSLHSDVALCKNGWEVARVKSRNRPTAQDGITHIFVLLKAQSKGTRENKRKEVCKYMR